MGKEKETETRCEIFCPEEPQLIARSTSNKKPCDLNSKFSGLESTPIHYAS